MINLNKQRIAVYLYFSIVFSVIFGLSFTVQGEKISGAFVVEITNDLVEKISLLSLTLIIFAFLVALSFSLFVIRHVQESGHIHHTKIKKVISITIALNVIGLISLGVYFGSGEDKITGFASSETDNIFETEYSIDLIEEDSVARSEIAASIENVINGFGLNGVLKNVETNVEFENAIAGWDFRVKGFAYGPNHIVSWANNPNKFETDNTRDFLDSLVSTGYVKYNEQTGLYGIGDSPTSQKGIIVYNGLKDETYYHEYSHARIYTDTLYEATANAWYASFSQNEIDLLVEHYELEKVGYNVDDSFVVMDELLAYLIGESSIALDKKDVYDAFQELEGMFPDLKIYENTDGELVFKNTGSTFSIIFDRNTREYVKVDATIENKAEIILENTDFDESDSSSFINYASGIWNSLTGRNIIELDGGKKVYIGGDSTDGIRNVYFENGNRVENQALQNEALIKVEIFSEGVHSDKPVLYNYFTGDTYDFSTGEREILSLTNIQSYQVAATAKAMRPQKGKDGKTYLRFYNPKTEKIILFEGKVDDDDNVISFNPNPITIKEIIDEDFFYRFANSQIERNTYLLLKEVFFLLFGDLINEQVEEICREERKASEPFSTTPSFSSSTGASFGDFFVPETEGNCQNSLTIITAQATKLLAGPQIEYETSYTITACNITVQYNVLLESDLLERTNIASGTTNFSNISSEVISLTHTIDFNNICVEVTDRSIGEDGKVCFEIIDLN